MLIFSHKIAGQSKEMALRRQLDEFLEADLDDFEDEIAPADSERHDSEQPDDVANVFGPLKKES